MYAIIETGGKQFKIKKNNKIKVEKIKKNIGEIIKLKIIMLFNKKNKIIINKKDKNKYLILAKIKKHIKDKKINIIKFKRRKNYKRKIGHRQNLTILKIISIKEKKNGS